MKQPAKRKSKTLRRSVALPQSLVDELNSIAASELRSNMNRLVIVALEEYVARRKQDAFEVAMREMAQDESVQKVSHSIASEFIESELDGLKD